ncbi:3D domain-containing protein [Maribacter algicola]|uniref:3D domain-containing protein n=1 Tax=Meishania litoralis TaxID=3434685 RepID=A0ACC7LKT4_9FLAO
MTFKTIILLGVLSFFSACKEEKEKYIWKPLEVTVSAYNSVSWQTSGNPNIAAWGDTLKPGMKSVAVSRDLLQLGLTHNTQIKIEGLDSIYLVKDKMHSRWSNRIDLYMGKDVKKAREWGRKKLTILYAVLNDSLQIDANE